VFYYWGSDQEINTPVQRTGICLVQRKITNHKSNNLLMLVGGTRVLHKIILKFRHLKYSRSVINIIKLIVEYICHQSYREPRWEARAQGVGGAGRLGVYKNIYKIWYNFFINRIKFEIFDFGEWDILPQFQIIRRLDFLDVLILLMPKRPIIWMEWVYFWDGVHLNRCCTFACSIQDMFHYSWSIL
jgi:hypothetical protein